MERKLILEKGQSENLNMVAGKVLNVFKVAAGWDFIREAIDLDLSVIILDEQGKWLDEVYFRKLQSEDGAVKHSGDNLTGKGDGDDEHVLIDVPKLNAKAKYLIPVITSFSGHTFDLIRNAFVRVVDPMDNSELVRFNLNEFHGATGLFMAKFTRQNDAFTMTALGKANEGTAKTLADMIEGAKAIALSA